MKIPWRREWQPTPVFLPGEFHGQRSLAGYSPWGCKESDMTEWLSTHTEMYLLHPIRKWVPVVMGILPNWSDRPFLLQDAMRTFYTFPRGNTIRKTTEPLFPSYFTEEVPRLAWSLSFPFLFPSVTTEGKSPFCTGPWASSHHLQAIFPSCFLLTWCTWWGTLAKYNETGEARLPVSLEIQLPHSVEEHH